MNVDDYVNGTQYIILHRGQFKSQQTFDDILSFLKAPKGNDTVKIPIDMNRINHGSPFINHGKALKKFKEIPNINQNVSYECGGCNACEVKADE